MLLDLTINGRTRKVITQAAKNGFFYVIDTRHRRVHLRRTVREGELGARHGQGRPADRQPGGVLRSEDPIAILPTSGGGHNWSPMSYNPTTGLVYIPASYQHASAMRRQAEYKPGTTGFTAPER